MQQAYNPEQLNQLPGDIEVSKVRIDYIEKFTDSLNQTINAVYPSELSVIDDGGEHTPRITGHLELVGTETFSPEPVQIEVDQDPLAAARKAAEDARIGHEEWTQIPEDIDI